MRRHLNIWLVTASLSALSILSIPNAWAGSAAPTGTTKTVNVLITTKQQNKSDIKTSTINRTLKGQCQMVAKAPQQIGWGGTSTEQQAALAQSQANATAFQQQYAPSEDLTSQIAAGAEKCGDDEACMTALAMKLAQNPEIQKMNQNKDAAKAAVAGLNPDLGPARYQIWEPKQCTATITAHDTFVTDDPGGEGGMDAYKETKKIEGSAAVANWPGMFIETDIVGSTTTYRVAAAPPVAIASSSTLKGAGQEQVNLMLDTKLPEVIGPLKGVFGKQSTSVTGESGSVSLTWE
jgi:hypothetical protein